MDGKRILRPWQGIVYFLVSMILFYLIGPYVQGNWGIYGLMVTELLFLVLALLAVKIFGGAYKRVFPIKKPTITGLCGIFLFWIGTYLLMTGLNVILQFLFPELFFAMGQGISSVLNAPLWATLLGACVMPAICEEAMHRGVILNSMRPIGNKWIIIGIMALFFGLFHGSLLRFLPMAAAGAVLSYVFLETENMVYSSFFHFINNLFPSLLSAILLKNGGYAQTETIADFQIPLGSVGIYLLIMTAAPSLLYLGNFLLHWGMPGYRRTLLPRTKQQRGLNLGLLLGLSFGLFVLGILVLGLWVSMELFGL